MTRRLLPHPEAPTLERVKSTLHEQHGPYLSIYMPVQHAGATAKQNAIQLKNLLREARERLERLGHADPAELLDAAAGLDERDSFRAMREGLVLLRSADALTAFSLPFPVEASAWVSRRTYNIRPLVPLLDGDGNQRYYVLALSLKHVRLLEATEHGVRELGTAAAPQSLDEALQFDDIQQIDHVYPGSQGKDRGGISALSGHGVGPGDDKHEPQDEILRYCRAVDAGLRPILKDQHVPLVLAGVDYLLAIYREVNSYAHLAPQGLTGNPDLLRAEVLSDNAKALLAPPRRQRHEDAAEQYRQLSATARATNRLEAILPAAHAGRIAVLFVDPQAEIHGAFEPGSPSVEVRARGAGLAEGEDLLNLAIVQSVLHGASIVPLSQDAPLGGVGPIAAILRY